MQSLTDGQTRDGIISTLATRWASVDLASAKSWATGLQDNDRDLALDGLVNGLVYDDPKAALDIATAITDGRQRQRSLATVLSSWADREPEAALAYARTLEDGGIKDEILSNVIGTWGRVNPVAAAEAVSEIAQGQERAVGEITRAWAGADPQTASRWVERLPTGENKRVATAMLLATWAENDPVSASIWAEQHGDDEAATQLSLSWMSRDPQAAAEWTLRRAGGGEGAFDHVMSSWASSDLRRAAAWARALPRGATRDRAFVQVSESSTYDNPQASMTYVDEIADAAERSRARARIFDIWKARSPKDAERWRVTARLSASELAALDDVPEDGEDDTASGCVCPPSIEP